MVKLECFTALKLIITNMELQLSAMKVHSEFCALSLLCQFSANTQAATGTTYREIIGNLLKVIWLLWQKRHTFLA
jgi:hypothetical protein